MTSSSDETTIDEVTADEIESALVRFLGERTEEAVAPDVDLIEDGLVSSALAMELAVHLEQAYDIMITGTDLELANFRTVRSMAALVLRLRAAAVGSGP